MIVASFTKSGGSWLAWMLADALYSPDIYLDQVDRTTVLDA